MKDFIKDQKIRKNVNGDVRWSEGLVQKNPTSENPIAGGLVGIVVGVIMDNIICWFKD
ncbi:MAG: hypothetical protein J0665_18200 [Deltaproteobacteria bacterium]|nr:hypothetical protein [Deltaproteobacteria bacterium]